MRALEEQLSPAQFLRISRSARRTTFSFFESRTPCLDSFRQVGRALKTFCPN
jgi:hypothetical protein